MKVIHIITGLDPDGAETMMAGLICQMNPERFENEVISLTNLGAIGPQLIGAGIRVRALGLSGNPFSLWKTATLVRWLRESKPNVIQTWMYHSDLIGGLAARYAGGAPVIWGIHHSNLEARANKGSILMAARTCARLSSWLPKRIVCCSVAARSAHIKFGYAAEKTQVIPNGFDLARFQPRPSARQELRRTLGVSPDAILIGMAARYHANKDHGNFVAAAGEMHCDFPDAHYVLFGNGVDWNNPELVAKVRQAGIADRTHLLGSRRDVPHLFAAMDIVVSSSLAEAFPLAVGEAMACNVPCVVTDVGDSAFMVMDTGVVVPPQNSAALAKGIRDLLSCGAEARMRAGTAARKRIHEFFSLPLITQRYEDLYAMVTA